MTRVLVTGAGGLLGSNIVLEAGAELDVTAVYHTRPVCFPDAESVQADLSNPGAVREVFAQARPEWVIHCAAATAIETLEHDPLRARRLNVEMARIVAREARSADAKLLHVSTDSVFDGRGGPYGEQDPAAPVNEYARSKLQGEAAVLAEQPEALVVRTNLFGHSPSGDRSLAEWFYSRLTDGRTCPGFSDVFFSPVYACDLAGLFFELLMKGACGVLHVPGDTCLSKYEFGVRIARQLELDPAAVQPVASDQAGWSVTRPLRTCLDGSRLRSNFGVELPSLDAGLTRFCADLKSGYSRQLEAILKREKKDA